MDIFDKIKASEKEIIGAIKDTTGSTITKTESTRVLKKIAKSLKSLEIKAPDVAVYPEIRVYPAKVKLDMKEFSRCRYKITRDEYGLISEVIAEKF